MAIDGCQFLPQPGIGGGRSFGLAGFDQGAGPAFGFLVSSGRQGGLVQELKEGRGGLLSEVPQGLIENHLGAAPGLAVEEVAMGNSQAQAFLQTKGLGAELDFVGLVGFGFAAFVFDGKHGAVGMEFHHVADAMDGEAFRADGQATSDADAGA